METVERSYACGEPSKVAAHKGVAGAGRPPSLLVVASLKYSLHLLLGLSSNPAKLTSKKVAMSRD